ncbi:hypothetical protein J6590_098274 [Homalodisca vitripennis]|nr:hypothetical protein J6590_098274 [Homalodisca vitripennis]
MEQNKDGDDEPRGDVNLSAIRGRHRDFSIRRIITSCFGKKLPQSTTFLYLPSSPPCNIGPPSSAGISLCLSC